MLGYPPAATFDDRKCASWRCWPALVAAVARNDARWTCGAPVRLFVVPKGDLKAKARA